MISAVARWTGTIVLWIVVALLLTVTIVPRFLDRVYYEGPPDGNFDGAHFFNPDEGEGEWSGDPTRAAVKGGSRGPGGFLLRWITGADQRPAWPDHVAVAQARPKALPPVKPGEMRATWIGHASVLIETPGLNILTDPIWSDVAGPLGIGPHRVAAPGIAFDDLPRIDLIVVSHNHYDHMDMATLKRLWERDRPVIVTSPGNEEILAAGGVSTETCNHCLRYDALVMVLDWGRSEFIADRLSRDTGLFPRELDVKVTVTRNHHWSSRWGADRNRALWSSFVIDTPSGSVFFAGDTGPGDMRWPDEARRRAAGPIRLAIIPIGAFRFAPGQMWSGSHVGPKHAVEAFERLGATTGLPIHWGTFRLSWEGYDTPPKMLALEAQCAGLPADRFAAHRIGASFMVPAAARSQSDVRGPKPRCDQAAIDALP
ncbi:hydrolase [Sphingorhabdus soli]|uniref:Hydrolase n=2 Tax=Flavisphingopyxis soli TaxID=2601267 RepID=A0A5C6UMG4_9SPHN|nr:MBL fold metallo-hydrolase [Sphingorhabdus soli]TXC74363.1 hydrolase [Sphingorhabdus soli]